VAAVVAAAVVQIAQAVWVALAVVQEAAQHWGAEPVALVVVVALPVVALPLALRQS
jgi:hypothetical protein